MLAESAVELQKLRVGDNEVGHGSAAIGRLPALKILYMGTAVFT